MEYERKYTARSHKEHVDGMVVDLKAASLTSIERQKLMIERELDCRLVERVPKQAEK